MGQLIWAIVVPMPGHLDVYSWLGGHCEDHHPRNPERIIGRRISEEPADGRTKLSTAVLGSFTDSFTDID